MGLLSFFSRNKQAAAKPGKPARGGRSPARQAPLGNAQNPDTADALREVRARARTRLMGATVLLLVGVIGFPLLFETQPRPVPVDLPIEIPARNAPGVADGSAHAHAGSRATTPAATHAASGPAPESVSYDARPSAPAAASSPASQASGGKSAFASLAAALSPSSAPSTGEAADKAAYVAPSMGGKGPAKPAARLEKADKAEKADKSDKSEKSEKAGTPAPAASKPVLHTAGPVLPPAPDAKPAALLAGASSDKPSDAAAGGRFVVQVGAFLEDAKVREARGKVEKLGLKTYTQPVDTPTGKRIRVRVGPFATKAEADKVAGRIKAEGQTAVVLAL